jgi:hypothetical protein
MFSVAERVLLWDTGASLAEVVLLERGGARFRSCPIPAPGQLST